MKNKTNTVLIVIGVIVVLFVLGFIGSFNSLQRMDENVNSSWAQVENQLQRRYDLIPNIVATVKQYSDYEGTTLENVVKARSGVSSVEDEQKLDEQYTSAMKELSLVVEAYPELKANTQYSELITELEGTENRIAVARKDYNDEVTKLNAKIRTFPASMIANMSGVEKRDYFKNTEDSNDAVDVNALFE